MAKRSDNEWIYWVVSEVATFALVYYIQYLFNIQANLWLSSAIIFILLNISIIFCPVLRKCCKN